MTNVWKVLAIIFIVLFILETIFLAWVWNIGTEAVDNENKCAINVCDEYDAYYYDSYYNICYCYEDGEIVYQEYME